MALMSIKNLTIGFFEIGLILKIDKINNKITGPIGSLYDRIYVHKNKRDCILKSVDNFENDDNPTNKSFYELAKLDLVDIYYFPTKDEFSSTPEYLENTKIISTNPFQLSQFIRKPTKFQQTDLSSFLFNNLNLLSIISIGYLLIILSFFLFTKLIDCRRIKIKFYNLLSLNYYKQCPLTFKFGLLKLFFNLFLFINLILLTNSIKTNKVIVKTDEFLNTDEKLLKSPKKFVFDHTNEDRYRLSPKTNPIFQLYQKKVHIEQNYLIITGEYKKVTNLNALHFRIKNLSSFFIIDEKIYNLLLLAHLSLYSKDEEFLYFDNKIYFEISHLFYFRKSLKEEIKKMVHWSTNQYFENGLYLEIKSKIYNDIYRFIRKNGIKIILNVNDYINEQTKLDVFLRPVPALFDTDFIELTPVTNMEKLLKISSKSIGGFFGEKLDKFFAGKDKRGCQFIATNDNLKTIMESSKKNQIDFYVKPDNLLGYNLSGIEYSTPCTTEKVYLGQILDKPEASNDDALGFIEHTELIVEFIIIGFLLKLLFIFIFLLFKKRKHDQNNRINLKIFRNFYNYYDFNQYLLTKFNLIMIFYLLFNHLNLILITNNIKTNEVILNLDQLIDSSDQLFKIDRYACWLKNSRLYDFVMKLDKNSLIYKIYQLKRKSPNDVCYLNDFINDYTKLGKLDLGKSFFIMNQPMLLFNLSTISRLQSIKRKIGFIISSIFNLEFNFYSKKGVLEDGFAVNIDKINNKLIGQIGRIYDKINVHKNKRDCILKSVQHFEDNHTNKSFFEMAKYDKIDIFFSPMKNKFSKIPEYLENTKIVSTVPYQLGQFLVKPTIFQQTDLLSFLFNNLNSLLMILIGYLLIFSSFFLFTKLINGTIKIKFYNLLSLNYNQLCSLSFKFGLLKLFFNLFLFISLILLKNSIQTDKVIVKTDEFLNTDEKLLKSSKRFLFDEFSEDNYRLLGKTNLIFKLYQKKVDLEQNYFKITPQYNLFEQKFITENLSSFFMIDDKFTILYYFTLLSYSKDEEFIYLDNRNYFEMSSSFYFRKSLNKEIKNLIQWSTNQYFENGIYLEFKSNLFNLICKSIKNNGILIIQSVNDYVNQQSVVSVHADYRCLSGFDQTIYANDLINQIKLNSEMKLPQRYIGSIFLKYGGMFNVSSVNLINQPVKIICANRTLGALQIKLSIDQVILAYSWSFGEKCEGIAKTSPQDILIDLNLEKNENDRKTRILSSYTSALSQTDFNILIKKCNYLNIKTLESQVKNVCKKAALHDVDLILQNQVKTFTNEFITKNELFLY